jgi:hypothetical protein
VQDYIGPIETLAVAVPALAILPHYDVVKEYIGVVVQHILCDTLDSTFPLPSEDGGKYSRHKIGDHNE